MTTSISLRIWNCFRRYHRIFNFFRNIFRNALLWCFGSARKVSVYKAFRDICVCNARKFSRPPRYDRFDNPPCWLFNCAFSVFFLAFRILDRDHLGQAFYRLKNGVFWTSFGGRRLASSRGRLKFQDRLVMTASICLRVLSFRTWLLYHKTCLVSSAIYKKVKSTWYLIKLVL